MGTKIQSLSLVLLLIALSILSATHALAQSDEQVARSAFRLGNAHYENGEFIEAAEQFEKAYRYSGKAQLLYNLYLAYRDANLPEKAADALRRYLAEAKDVPNREQIEAKLRALERGIAKQKQKKEPPAVVEKPAEPEEKPVEPTTVEPVEEPVAMEPAPEESEPEETFSDEPSDESYLPLISYIMMGAGGGMIIGSIITGIATSSAQSELEDECPDKVCPSTANIEDLKSTRDTGETMALVTDILLFGGIAVAGAGVALFFLSGDAEESESSPVAASVGCSTKGCKGSVRFQF